MLVGIRRGHASRDPTLMDRVVKVVLPAVDRSKLPRDEKGHVIATVYGEGRFGLRTQPISKVVLEECINAGGSEFYVADFSKLLDMWIIDYRAKAQSW